MPHQRLVLVSKTPSDVLIRIYSASLPEPPHTVPLTFHHLQLLDVSQTPPQSIPGIQHFTLPTLAS